jgi:hypothetical protein
LDETQANLQIAMRDVTIAELNVNLLRTQSAYINAAMPQAEEAARNAAAALDRAKAALPERQLAAVPPAPQP